VGTVWVGVSVIVGVSVLVGVWLGSGVRVTVGVRVAVRVGDGVKLGRPVRGAPGGSSEVDLNTSGYRITASASPKMHTSNRARLIASKRRRVVSVEVSDIALESQRRQATQRLQA
jgi:hypothetical protein